MTIKYRVGLVLSMSGMNANQLADVKARLKFIAQFCGGGDGCIDVTVPSGCVPGSECARDVDALLVPFLRMGHVVVTVVPNVRSPQGCLDLLKDHDEVWCLPARGQTITKKARACVIFALAVRQNNHKYKLIPPWSGVEAVNSKDIKPKAMRG